MLLSVFFTERLVAQNLDSSEGDRRALMDLFKSTNGAQWENKTGWSTSSMDLSDDIWGVGVEEINGELRVVHIDLQRGTKTPPEPFSDPTNVLPGNNVSGELPNSLGNLSEIRYFNIKQNFFTGTLPQSLSNWTKVKRILIGGHTREPKVGRYNHPTAGGVAGQSKQIYTTNRFSGILPDIFGNMISLEVFESQGHAQTDRLSKNPDWGWSGEIPLYWPTSLKMLFLGGNHFEGNIPKGLTETNVSILYLFYNKLSGNLLPELGNLSDMTHLSMERNNFDGSIPSDWAGFQRLQMLTLHFNNLSGSIPEFLFDGRNNWIEGFRLEFNNFSGEIPQNVNTGDYPHWNVFSLSYNNFSGPIPDWIPNLRWIQLNFEHNDFSGDLPSGFHDSDANMWKRLRNLKLQANSLTGPVPQANPGPKIWIYYLENNNFTGTFSQELGQTTTTRDMRIRVQNNNMSGEVPANIANITNLSELFLDNNRFSQSDLQDIKNAIPGSVDYRDGGQNPSDGSDGDDEPTGAIDIPIPLSPGDESTDVTLTPTFEWSDEGADAYQLHITRAGQAGTTLDVTINATSFTLSDSLESNVSYVWRVRALNNETEGEWSEFWEFETGTDRTGEQDDFVCAPVLLAPEHMEQVEPDLLTFEWSSSDADEYILHLLRENEQGSHDDIFLSDSDGVAILDTTYTLHFEILPEKIHTWRVKGVKDGVEGEWSELQSFITDAENQVTSAGGTEGPLQTGLNQNYPNPFNPSTQIEYTLSDLQEVSLRVYDMAGRQVAILVDGVKQAGRHTATFNAGNLASGIYFYRFITNTQVYTKKMTLVK